MIVNIKHEHQPLIAGQMLLQEMPLVYTISPRLARDYCAGCFRAKVNLRKSEKLKECQCECLWYCSEVCASFDAMFHVHECQIFKNYSHNRKLHEFFFRNALRVWILMKHIPRRMKREYVAFGKTYTFFDLDGKEEDILKNPKSISKRRKIISLFREIKLDLNEEEFMPIFYRFMVNAMFISDIDHSVIGRGLYLGATALAHSCIPNAGVVFTGLKMRVNSLKKIAKNGQITISFCDSLEPKAARRNVLQNVFLIDCNCRRCRHDYDENITGEICQLLIDIKRRKEKSTVDWDGIAKDYDHVLIRLKEVFGKHSPARSVQLIYALEARINAYNAARKKKGQKEFANKPAPRFDMNFLDLVSREIIVTHGTDHDLFAAYLRLRKRLPKPSVPSPRARASEPSYPTFQVPPPYPLVSPVKEEPRIDQAPQTSRGRKSYHTL